MIEPVHYLADPALVRLLPRAAEALIRLRRAGFARVLVTNQSAIGRGMLTEDRLDEIHIELFRLTESFGQFHDSERLVVHSDQAHFRRGNLTVDAM